MEEEIKRVLIIAKGRVQGVGFRWFVRGKAIENNIKGYVMNLPNGDVEIVAVGKEKDIKNFLASIKVSSPFGINVESLTPLQETKVSLKSFKEMKEFYIRR